MNTIEHNYVQFRTRVRGADPRRTGVPIAGTVGICGQDLRLRGEAIQRALKARTHSGAGWTSTALACSVVAMTNTHVFSETYKRAYSRGWAASRRYTDASVISPLERADDRGEPSAWYHGYHDHAAGRPRFVPLIHGTREDYFRKFYSEEI